KEAHGVTTCLSECFDLVVMASGWRGAGSSGRPWLRGFRAAVPCVGPGQPDADAAAGQVPQQRAGGVAVLDRGRGDQHGQHQAGGSDVAATAMCRLRPLTFLALSQSWLAL